MQSELFISRKYMSASRLRKNMEFKRKKQTINIKEGNSFAYKHRKLILNMNVNASNKIFFYCNAG